MRPTQGFIWGGTRSARWCSVIATILPVVPFLIGAPVSAAKPAGQSVSLTVGYLSALQDHNTIWVQGQTSTFTSDNIFIGAMAEGPLLWKSVYPLAAAKWLFDNRYQTETFPGRIDARSFLVCAGIGCGLDAWQATLRLQAAAGFWWEDIRVDYSGFVGYGQAFELVNDEVALLLAASLAFPFTSRLDALVSCEFVGRAENEFDGSFENGRDYQLITNGTYATVSIGLTMDF